MATMHHAGGPSGLPLSLLAQAIPMLTKHELEAVVERLIDQLDTLSDPDEDCAVDDYGCDEREQGDLEDDRTHYLPIATYGIDQRDVHGDHGLRFLVD